MLQFVLCYDVTKPCVAVGGCEVVVVVLNSDIKYKVLYWEEINVYSS